MDKYSYRLLKNKKRRNQLKTKQELYKQKKENQNAS